MCLTFSIAGSAHAVDSRGRCSAVPVPIPRARALSAADVGFRVVVRRQLPSGMGTDVLGKLLSFQDGALVIRRSDGAEIRIDRASVRAGKRVPPGPARVRPAGLADAFGIETLRVRCWGTAYRGMIPDAFLDALPASLADGVVRRQLSEPGRRHVVAEAAGGLVGWAAGGPSRDADQDLTQRGEVDACSVAPEWSGVGLGGRLLRRLLSDLAAEGLTEMSLWVFAANSPARRFYAGYGFEPDGAERVLDLGGPVVEIRCVRR